MAYVTDDGVTSEERGLVVSALAGHAFVYLLLVAVDGTWIALVAARVWRRRDSGLAQAVLTDVHWPTLVVLLSANLLYEILRRTGAAKLDGRISEYAARERRSS